MQSFSSMECLQFCQKLQGFHAQITKDFTLNFIGIDTKVGILSLNVSQDTISHATKIPRLGETWFKVNKFQLHNCDEFLKEEHQWIDMTVVITRTFLKENYSKLFMVIQKYFTYEGRFHMVYQYHFSLFLHFTCKQSLDIPFYLFESLGKMVVKVKSKLDTISTSIFHNGIIKLLVVEYLNRLNRDWLTFFFLSGYELGIATPSRKTPKSKSATPRVEQQSVS